MAKLLGQPASINVRKVLWTCHELGLKPDREDWGGSSQSTDCDEFRRFNPKGLVPVWIEDDLILTESNTICRYLAARQSRTDLLPVQAAARARVEAWMDWQATELNSAWRAVFVGRVRKNPAFSDPNLQQASIAEWTRQMTMLNQQLEKTQAFVVGDSFTLADIVLALSVNRWESTPMERPAMPCVAGWMERLAERPGFGLYCRNGYP